MTKKPFKCQMCDHRGFHSKIDLDRHVSERHCIGEPLRVAQPANDLKQDRIVA